MRWAWRGISSSTSAVFHRCQTSNWIPTASLPTSSTNSAASASVFRIDQLSMPSSWNGSTARRRPSRSGLARDLAHAADRGLAVAGAGEAEDRRRLVRREDLERAEQRVDPLTEGVRTGQQRQRVNGGDRGNGRRRAEAARAELLERAVVELELPDSDPVDSGLGVRAHVVGEARGERADLRDREPRRLRFSRHPDP